MEALNTAWIIICGVLVLLMQPGFACLQAGLVRHHSGSAIAIKSIATLCVGCLVFVAVGSQLMFGPTIAGLVGRPALSSDLIAPEQFLYFAVLGAVATSIASGAVAERVGLGAHLLIAILICGVLYPIVGHWAWSESGWLAQQTFFDGAGSAVIHAVGGAVALGGLIAVGPRAGAFTGGKKILEHASPPTAMMGVLMLWVGWFGLTGGAGLRFDNQVPNAMLATLLGGAAGGATAMLLSLRKGSKNVRVSNLIGGVLAGLVSISAAATMVSMRTSILVAAVGGAIYIVGARFLEKAGIDDAVGAVPAHLFAGIWGTLAVALPAPFGGTSAGADVLSSLSTQVIGVASISGLALVAGFVTIKVASRFSVAKTQPATHSARIEIPKTEMSEDWSKLAHALDQSTMGRNSIRPLEVEVSGETEVFAKLYNQVAMWLRASKDEMEYLRSATGRDPLTGLYNRATFLEYLEKSLAMCKRSEKHGAVLFVDMDGFKPVNDHWGHSAGDRVLREVGVRMRDSLRENDTVARVGGDEFCVLIELLDDPSYSEVVAQKVLALFEDAFVIDGLELKLGASIGIASFSPDHNESAGSIVKSADQAMYHAKAKGKGQYCVYRKDEHQMARPPQPEEEEPEPAVDGDGETNVAIFPPANSDTKTETG